MTVLFFFFQNPERKESKLTTKEKIKQINLLAAAFLVTAIVCLLLALQVRSIQKHLLAQQLTLASGAASSIPGHPAASGAASSVSAS